MTILVLVVVSQRLCRQLCSYAKQLLVFVENMKALYGKEMICARLDSFEAPSDGNSPHSAATC